LRDVIDSLAIKLGISVEGASAMDAKQEITAHLRDRTAREVFTRLAGSVGMTCELRPSLLVLRAARDTSSSADDLRGQALAAYLRALRAFPGHPGAAHAKLEEARIEEARGNDRAALAHYEDLIQHDRNSELLPEALMKCAELSMRNKEWPSALHRLNELLRLDRRHPFEIPARIALARCEAMVGDHERAFYMLDVIDVYSPSMEPEEIQRRLLIRARAQLAANGVQAAIDSLDHVEKLGRREEFAAELFELRGRAAEANGDPRAASRAWLSCAMRSKGADRGDALVQAARLAAECGDDTAALFIGKLAERSGGGDTAKDLSAQVAQGLGLQSTAARALDSGSSIARAERMLAAGLAPEAAPAFKALYADRESLDEAAFVRVASGCARALDATEGTDSAIALLRDALGSAHENESRRALYLVAGELYEAHQRLDEAVEAYQGRL
jgi:tetratricopeptide (TPR) repeat protein